VEIGADVLLKGTRVDGVYSADPERVPDAVKFDRISHEEVYRRGLQVMDLTATTLCRENGLPVSVFNMEVEGNLARVTRGEPVGTVVG
jgi:uridylate kinase